MHLDDITLVSDSVTTVDDNHDFCYQDYKNVELNMEIDSCL